MIRTEFLLIVITTVTVHNKCVNAFILVKEIDRLNDNQTEISDTIDNIPWNDGPKFPEQGLRALVVRSTPNDGCSSIQGPPASNLTKINGSPLKWAVAVSRFNCSFETKIRNVQAADYDVAIIYNVASDDLVEINVADSEGITIPATFIRESEASTLLANHQYFQGFFIEIDALYINLEISLSLLKSLV